MNTEINRSRFLEYGYPKKLSLLLMTVLALAACSEKESAAPRPLSVYVTSVHNTVETPERKLTAVLRPRVETELAFRVSGKLIARYVEIGQSVRAGDVVARVDANDYALATGAAEEQVRAAHIDATQTASDATRFERLAADGFLSNAALERQQARSNVAAATAKQAMRQLDLARNRLTYTTLKVPFDGVISGLRFEVGQVVAEGVSIATLARAEELEVVADIPEEMAGDLSKYTASAKSWYHTGTTLSLRLRELAPTATPQARTFRARFSLDQNDKAAIARLRMGATVQLHLARAVSEPSARLPISAMLTTDQSPAVWVADEKRGALIKQPVRVIAQSTDAVRVVGLPEGALIVSVGAQKLDANMMVHPVRRPMEALASMETQP